MIFGLWRAYRTTLHFHRACGRGHAATERRHEQPAQVRRLRLDLDDPRARQDRTESIKIEDELPSDTFDCNTRLRVFVD